jgi:hypothetical protein
MRPVISFCFYISFFLINFTAFLSAEPINIVGSEILLPKEKENEYPLKLKQMLALKSSSKNFGGFSGFVFTNNFKKIIAITDRSHWLETNIERNSEGKITTLSNSELYEIRDRFGNPLNYKMSDSEGLSCGYTCNQFFVSFERTHRITSFQKNLSDSHYIELALPSSVQKLEYNEGFEAIRYLKDGRFVAFAEALYNKDNFHVGWLRDTKNIWTNIFLKPISNYKITDIVELKNGDLITLERSFGFFSGLNTLIRHIPANQVKSNAHLTGKVLFKTEGYVSLDNTEGLAIDETDNVIRVYLISDDNFNSFQQTIISVLEMKKPL